MASQMNLLSPFARPLSLVFDIKFLLFSQAFREDVSRMAKAVQVGEQLAEIDSFKISIMTTQRLSETFLHCISFVQVLATEFSIFEEDFGVGS